MATLENIKTDDDLNKVISDAVKEAVNGLKSKNDELLGKFKDLRSLTDKLDGLDIDELISAKGKLDEIEKGNLEKRGEYEKLIANMREQHESKVAELEGKLKASNDSISKMIINNGIGSALDSNKVNPVLRDAALNLLSGSVSIVDKDGTKVGMVGDKTIEEHVKDWASTDVGKNFVLADENRGSGGGSNTTVTVNDYEKYFHKGEGGEFNVTKQTELYKNDPASYKLLMEKHSN